VWLAAEPANISPKARAAIRRALASGGLAIASISVWEMAMLFARGRIRSAGTTESALARILEATAISVREITPSIAALATQFPESFPKDPADRLIAATARAENVPLVTQDDRIRESPLLKTIW
jgi:PIN domain nuclease of toxin-antitoxin system